MDERRRNSERTRDKASEPDSWTQAERASRTCSDTHISTLHLAASNALPNRNLQPSPEVSAPVSWINYAYLLLLLITEWFPHVKPRPRNHSLGLQATTGPSAGCQSCGGLLAAGEGNLSCGPCHYSPAFTASPPTHHFLTAGAPQTLLKPSSAP